MTKNSTTQATTMTKNSRRPLPRLDRRNAAKNIDYSLTATATSSPSLLMTRSLDLSPPYSDDQTSFRISDGEVELLFRNLGISGPEDFAIPAAAWEAARAHRSSSDLLPRSRLSPAAEFLDPPRVSDSGIRGVRPPILASSEAKETISTLSSPPTVSGAVEVEMMGASWDLIRSFAPQEEEEVRVRLEEENPDEVTSTSNYDDSPARTREMIFVISPDAKFKRRIKSWMKGQLLGSGSFGTVYEGISE